MMCRLPAVIASTFLIGAAPLAMAQTLIIDPDEALEEVRVILDESSARIQTVDTVLDQADFEAEALVDFVRGDILYHPYHGVQRGVEGTLLSRSGNSWDQAVTLASLLTEAGYEALVAYGTIDGVTFPTPQAAALPSDLPPDNDFEALVTARMADIEAALAAVNLELGAGEPVKEVTYAWVRWRDAPGDPYTDVHPIFEDVPSGLMVDQQGAAAGSVPQDQVVSLAVRPFIEVRTGDAISRQWAALPVKGAVANMWGMRQVYAFVPSTAVVVSADLPETDEEAQIAYDRLVNSPSFIALRNGLPMERAQHINRRGEMLSPDVAASAMAGVFETIALQTGDAANALAALGATEKETTSVVPELVSAGFNITVTGPEMPDQTYTRYVLTPETPTQNTAAWFANITQSIDLIVQPGPEPTDTIIKRTAQDYEILFETYKQLQAGTTDLNEAFSEFGALDLQSTPAMTAAIPVTSFGRQIANDTAQSGPMIAALITRVTPDPTFTLSSQRRVFDIMQRPVSGPAESVMLRGVVESLAEQFSLSGDQGYGAATLLAADAMLIPVSDVSLLEGVRVADIAQDPMLADLKAGQIVLVTAGVDPALAWWRIDPRTGSTLGRSHAGWGNELTEFLGTMQVTFSAVSAILNAGKCGYTAAKSGSGVVSVLGCTLCVGIGAVGDLVGLDGAVDSGQKILAGTCSAL